MTEVQTVVGVATVKRTEFEGKIENAYGLPLSELTGGQITELDFSGSFEEIVDFAAIPPKEMPEQKDVLALVNNKRKANARQKAMQEILDANKVKKPTLADNVELRIKSITDGLLASKLYTAESARAFALQALGISE